MGRGRLKTPKKPFDGQSLTRLFFTFSLVKRAACRNISRAVPPDFDIEISRRRGLRSGLAKKNSTFSLRVSRGIGTKI